MFEDRGVLDHISLGVSDLARSREFYDAVLAPLGYRRLWSADDAAGYGVAGTDEPFAIKHDPNGGANTSARLHIAFRALTRGAVVQFRSAALQAGARADGEAELHPMYGDDYFAAFVVDPDGHRLEAVCHAAESSPGFSLDHVQLAMPAGQEEAARRFYADVLGLLEVPKPPQLALRGGAWFRGEAVFIHLGVDPAFTPAKKAHPALRCRTYDALLERLAARGVAIVEDPIAFDDSRYCYVVDPFGNRLELIDGGPSTGSGSFDTSR